MNRVSFFRMAASVVLALALTVFVYRWDQSRVEARQKDNALQWARQVAVQAEGMAIYARSQGVEKPADWAISFLGQSVEPRIMKIAKFRRSEDSKELEFHRIENGVLDYGKVARPENGEGFRIQILLQNQGFLGAQSRFGNDAGLAAVFLIFCLSSLPFFLKSGRPEAGPVPDFSPWLNEAQHGVKQLGVSLRDVLKDAQDLAIASNQAKERVVPVHEQLRKILETVRSLRQSICSHASKEERKNNSAPLNGYQLLDAELEDLEKALEPLCTRIESAVPLFEQALAATHRLNSDATVFKTGLIAHFKHLKEIPENEKKAA